MKLWTIVETDAKGNTRYPEAHVTSNDGHNEANDTTVELSFEESSNLKTPWVTTDEAECRRTVEDRVAWYNSTMQRPMFPKVPGRTYTVEQLAEAK